jgi:nitrate reductase NapAB chaperone NapD
MKTRVSTTPLPSTSALVLTLDADAARRHQAFYALSQRQDLCSGPLEGDRLPVVLESDDANAAEATCRELSLLEGVLHVEIVFIGLADAPAPSARECTS